MKIARWLTCVLLLGCGVGVLGCVAEAGSGESAAEPTASATEASTTNCATLYADANWMGASLTVARGVANVPGTFNDVTSSVAVATACKITLYADANESGSSVTFTESSATVPAWFNDAASSYACSCVTCAPRLHWCGWDEGCLPACY